MIKLLLLIFLIINVFVLTRIKKLLQNDEQSLIFQGCGNLEGLYFYDLQKRREVYSTRMSHLVGGNVNSAVDICAYLEPTGAKNLEDWLICSKSGGNNRLDSVFKLKNHEKYLHAQGSIIFKGQKRIGLLVRFMDVSEYFNKNAHLDSRVKFLLRELEIHQEIVKNLPCFVSLRNKKNLQLARHNSYYNWSEQEEKMLSKAAQEAAGSSMPANTEFKINRYNTLLTFSVHSVNIADYVLSYIQDVTDKARLESQLQDLLAKESLLFSSLSTVGVVICDSNSYIKFFNSAVKKIIPGINFSYKATYKDLMISLYKIIKEERGLEFFLKGNNFANRPPHEQVFSTDSGQMISIKALDYSLGRVLLLYTLI